MSHMHATDGCLDFGPNFNIDTVWDYYLSKLKVDQPPFDCDGIITALSFFEAVTKGKIFKLTTSLLDRAAPIVLDLVFSLEFSVHATIQMQACAIMSFFCAKLCVRFDSTFVVRFERVFDFFRVFLKHRDIVQARYKKLDCYYRLICHLRPFFPPDDIQPVLDRWFDNIGYCDTRSILPLIYLTMFLPASGLPQVLDSFTRILDEFPTAYLASRILCYFGHAAHDPIFIDQKIDWTPYLDRIFLGILRLLQPSVKIGDKTSHLVNSDRRQLALPFSYIGSQSEQNSPPTYALISALLVDGEQGELVVRHIERLVAILLPLIGSSSDKESGMFIPQLIITTCKAARISSARKQRGFSYVGRSPAILAKFASAVFPFVKSLAFSHLQKFALQTLPILAGFNYSLVRDDLFTFAIKHLVDYEMVEFSAGCARIVAVLVPSMFEGDHFQENTGLLADILGAVAETVQSRAPRVLSAALNIIKSTSALVSAGDSQASVLMAANFRPFFATVVDHYMSTAQCDDEPKPGRNTMLTTEFFAAFRTPFVEAQLPWIFERLSEGDANSRAHTMLTPIAIAHRSLIPQLASHITSRLAVADGASAQFWRCSLAAILLPVPELADILPAVIQTIKDTIATDEKDRFRAAHSIARGLTSACYEVGLLSVSTGALVRMKDLAPQLHRLAEADVIAIAEQLYDAYRPTLDAFPTLRLREQLAVASILSAFGDIFMIRGDFATGTARPLPPLLAELFAKLLGHVRAWLAHELNSQLVKEVLDQAFALTINLKVKQVRKLRRPQVLKWVDGSWIFFEIPLVATRFCMIKQLFVSTFFLPERNDVIEQFIRDIVFPLVSHDFWQIREAAIRFITQTNVATWRPLFASLSDANFATIARPDKTEGEFYGALRFLSVCVQATVADPPLFTRFIRTLFQMEFVSEWKVDSVIKSLMNVLEDQRVFLRRVAYLAPVFTALQCEVPTLRTGSLSEYWLRFLSYYLAAGPAPCELPIFQQFWRDLLSPEHGRKRLVLDEVSEFIFSLRARPPRALVDHFPGPQFFVDVSAVGFWTDPRRVKVATGPGVFAAESDVRQWLAADFTSKTARALIDILVVHREPNAKLDLKVVYLWRHLCWAIGPAVLDAVEPHVLMDDSENGVAGVCLEVAAGVARGAHRWAEDDARAAIKRVVAPIVVRFAFRNKAEIGTVLTLAVHMIVGDADYRRNGWLLEKTRDWLGCGADALRTGLQFLAVFAGETHASFWPTLTEIVVKEVLPRVLPLEEQPLPVIDLLAHVFSEWMEGGFSQNPRNDFGLLRVLFEQIFDVEVDRSSERLVTFMDALALANGHAGERVVPFIADRIVRIFTLRNEISTPFQPLHIALTRQLGFLPWHTHIELLGRLLDDLVKLFATAQWFLKEQILHFVHVLCFAQMFVIGRAVYRRIFSTLLVLFLQDERAELRTDAVRAVRMLIPLAWDDFGDFFKEAVDGEANQVVAAANGVALLGAVIVVNTAPPWLPALFDFLIAAHRRVREYSEIISQECLQFWKRIGSRSVCDIDEFRIAFSGGYFA